MKAQRALLLKRKTPELVAPAFDFFETFFPQGIQFLQLYEHTNKIIPRRRIVTINMNVSPNHIYIELNIHTEIQTNSNKSERIIKAEGLRSIRIESRRSRTPRKAPSKMPRKQMTRKAARSLPYVN